MKTFLVLSVLLGTMGNAMAGYVIYTHPTKTASGLVEPIIANKTSLEQYNRSLSRVRITTQSGHDIDSLFENHDLAKATYNALRNGQSIDVSACGEDGLILKTGTMEYNYCSILEKTPILNLSAAALKRANYVEITYEDLLLK